MENAIIGIMALRPTDDHLLISLLWFLAMESEAVNYYDPDLPIKAIFSAEFGPNEFTWSRRFSNCTTVSTYPTTFRITT